MASVYLFAPGEETKDCYADAVVAQKPMIEVLERIRILVARKHGPRPGSEAAKRCVHNKPVKRDTNGKFKEAVA